jgi:hypothetical protein
MKKPDHLYLDEHGMLHAPECPITKMAWSKKSDGPAQVATPAYRCGWARIFGGKEVVGQS